MQTHLIDKYKDSQEGREADDIVRSCVHCGFCTATCPTYQLLGDELDSPRGRIYLIKQLLEGQNVTERTQRHLDRCLTCRACETTCPSGVRYGRLVEIGRSMVDQHVQRSISETLTRKALNTVVPNNALLGGLIGAAQRVKPLLPERLKNKIPAKQPARDWPSVTHARTMLVLDGCVQSVAAATINVAAAHVLDKLGIQLVRAAHAGCCGALSHHLSAHEDALKHMRRNIDAWWPYIEQGVEAIVMTASGCGMVVKEYGMLLENDSAYADKAKKISSLTKDISEILVNEDLAPLRNPARTQKVAFQSPCTLQHGQKITDVVEKILGDAGYSLTTVTDPHLCCGSAGTYSVLQPDLSRQLLDNKLTSLQAASPDVIATANIGCQLHLATQAGVPVKHWIELIES